MHGIVVKNQKGEPLLLTKRRTRKVGEPHRPANVRLWTEAADTGLRRQVQFPTRGGHGALQLEAKQPTLSIVSRGTFGRQTRHLNLSNLVVPNREGHDDRILAL